MNTLSTVDVFVVIAYLVGTTLLGAWFSRKQRDIKTYFVGDRNVGWFLVLVSIVATETSTVTFLSVPGLAFREGGNFTFLQLGIGYILGRIVVAWALLPLYFRGECFSAYELLRDRFGKGVQRIASAMFLVTRTIADGLRLYLTALLLKQFTGWDMTLAIVVMSATTIVYTFLGGMQAVIWTDLIQFVVYILGAIVAAIFLIQGIDGGLNGLLEFGTANDKFRVIDPTFTFSKPLVLWAGVIGGAFFSMASHGADQIMVQRYLCAKSLGQARVALLSSGLVVFVQFTLFLFIGVGLAALYAAGKLSLVPNTPNDEVFGAFIVRELPVGVIGLIVAAVLAAAMSTLSSSLNSSSTALLTDFYKPSVSGRTESHYLMASKWFTVVCGLAQTIVALVTVWVPSDRSVIDKVLSVAGLTTGIVLGLFLVGRFAPGVRPRAVMIGLVAGLLTVSAVWVGAETGVVPLAWPWFALVGVISTFGVSRLSSALGVK